MWIIGLVILYYSTHFFGIFWGIVLTGLTYYPVSGFVEYFTDEL